MIVKIGAGNGKKRYGHQKKLQKYKGIGDIVNRKIFWFDFKDGKDKNNGTGPDDALESFNAPIYVEYLKQANANLDVWRNDVVVCKGNNE